MRTVIRRISAVAAALVLAAGMLLLMAPARAEAATAGNGEVVNVLEDIASLDPAAPQCHITYDLGSGHTFVVGPEMAMSLMKTNADGTYYVNPESKYYEIDTDKVRSFLSALTARVPVNNSTLRFVTATGKTIEFRNTAYTKRVIDLNSEVNYLTAAILNGTTETHLIGAVLQDTYVEVDMSGQKAYYYENGKLKWSSNVVTGNTSLDRGTPEGVYYINNKVRNTTLVGPNYQSPVSYWMPFIGNSIGLHDATWRSSFGGSIYKTNGSHGCVNLPLGKAESLFSMLKVGTPVVVHY